MNIVLVLIDDERVSSEIIKQLRSPLAGGPLRPSLSGQPGDEHLNALLRACWSENPDQRPPFGSIRRRLKETSPDRSDKLSARPLSTRPL